MSPHLTAIASVIEGAMQGEIAGDPVLIESMDGSAGNCHFSPLR
jgi:hypothetical protein